MDWKRLQDRYAKLKLGLLRRAWEQDSQVVRPLLAFRARAMSDRLLVLVGLVGGRGG
jgi:hypothetical protein